MFKKLSLAATLTLIVSVGLITCGAPQGSGGGGGTGGGGQEEDLVSRWSIRISWSRWWVWQ